MPMLTPRGTDFVEQASVRIPSAVEVNATPDEVWAVLTDHERWPEWFPAAKECRSTSDPAQGVGATRWIHFDLFKVNERFIVWEPSHRWAFTVLDANLPGITSVVEQFILESADDAKTVVRHTLAAGLAPYMRPMAPLLRWRNAALFRKGLAGIEGQVQKLRGEVA